MDDAHFSAEDDMDQDDEDEDGDVEMDFADETGSDDTSNTDEEPEEGPEDEARNIGEVWEDGEEEDGLVEHDEEDEEDEANEDNVHGLGGDYDEEDVVWQVCYFSHVFQLDPNPSIGCAWRRWRQIGRRSYGRG